MRSGTLDEPHEQFVFPLLDRQIGHIKLYQSALDALRRHGRVVDYAVEDGIAPAVLGNLAFVPRYGLAIDVYV